MPVTMHEEDTAQKQKRWSPDNMRPLVAGPAPPTVQVTLGSVRGYRSADGHDVGAHVHVLISANDNAALWRFFEVRQSQFEADLKRAVSAAGGGGKLVLQSVQYRHGSIEIIMLLIAVASQYSNIKNNLPIILADLDEVVNWISTAILPSVVEFVERFFAGYVDPPLVRLAKSIFKALFG